MRGADEVKEGILIWTKINISNIRFSLLNGWFTNFEEN